MWQRGALANWRDDIQFAFTARMPCFVFAYRTASYTTSAHCPTTHLPVLAAQLISYTLLHDLYFCIACVPLHRIFVSIRIIATTAVLRPNHFPLRSYVSYSYIFVFLPYSGCTQKRLFMPFWSIFFSMLFSPILFLTLLSPALPLSHQL